MSKPIVADPDIQGGTPCFAGTRIPVRAVKSFSDAGYSPARIVREYPDLTEDDVIAGLAYYGMTPEPLSPQARAVLTAANALVAAWDGPGGNRFGPMNPEDIRLNNAVRAYRASLQPQACKPEEVEPGTRFRFATGAVRHEDRTLRRVYVYLPEDDKKEPAFLIEETGMVCRFRAEHRIIPLPKDQ